ncbi:MAG TPA: hypothetical protein VF453_06510 [Burkholderiaceae bacterium]
MTRYYSKSTSGFYVDAIHGEAMPTDAVEISDDDYGALMTAQASGKSIVAGADGKPVATDPPAPTIDQQRATLSRAVQAHLDAVAKSNGYDSMATAVTYADEPAVPTYQADGKALRAWRSEVWSAALALINAQGALPTAAAILAALPAYVAPTAAS